VTGEPALVTVTLTLPVAPASAASAAMVRRATSLGDLCPLPPGGIGRSL